VTESHGGWSIEDEESGGLPLVADELGPFGCCDCCHQHGLNCGPKFPHGGFTGYLYLTPQWFNSLTRLGFALSGEAVAAISQEPAEGETDNLPPLRLLATQPEAVSGCFGGVGATSESGEETESSEGN